MSDPIAVHQLLGPVAPLLVSLAIGAWLLLRQPEVRAPRLLLAALLLAAALCPLWAIRLTLPQPFDDGWHGLASSRYEEIWAALDASSLLGATALEQLPIEEIQVAEIFATLGDLAARHDVSFLLIDPQGQVAAWAGSGLLHPIEGDHLPSTGPVFYSGFTSVTLGSVRRVARQEAPWRLVAGRSFSTQRLPFRSPSGGSRHDFVWTAVPEGRLGPRGAAIIEVEGRPSMSVLPAPGPDGGGRPRAVFLVQVAWATLGLVLLLVSRGEVERRTSALPPTIRTWPVVAGVTAVAVAFGVDIVVGVLLLSSLTVCAIAANRTSLLAGGSWWPLVPLGSVGVLMLLALRLEKVRGPIDLGNALDIAPETAVLRLVAMLIVLTGILPVVPRAPVGRTTARLWAGGLAATALGIGLAGTVGVAVLAVMGGATLLVAALRGRGPLRSWLDLALVLAVAALVGASTWEVTYRPLFARYLERDVTPALGPPTAEEQDRVDGRIRDYFAQTDLVELTPADPLELDEIDLAYALWNGSPLATQGALSATAVLIDGRPVSSFEFGVPLAGDGSVDRSPELWQALFVPGWQGALVEGEADLTYVGRPVGTVRYALLPRPGFRLRPGPIDRLAPRMVKGELATPLPVDEIVAPATFAVYEDRPRASLGGRDAPPLDPDELASPAFRVRADGVRYRGWTHPSVDATEVLLLGAPGPFETLERIGVHLLGTGSLVALAALVLWAAGGFSRERLTDGWHRIYRSYSKKLLLVYGLLLLLPLLLLSIVLLGVLGERLGRSQEIAAESAMGAAQHVLGEYILSLEPGFGVDTALDDDLLAWLARVIDHEVNLYWGSTLYASSNPELFTAGFLPTRIPGDIYAQLALESAHSASRPRQANRERYVELYAPLRIPGIRSQETLFLSIPLLAQQEQTAREIALLRTRAVLAALLLLVAVVAVASRLSYNFTLPLMRLVEGTEAIAAGASSVDLEPTELELATLVNAINDMAQRIGEARENLLREKQVMEKMVQNITAGVVSLDGGQRVLLRNRVAAEILGLEVGDSLDLALHQDERLAPLSDFLTSVGDSPRQGTLVVHSVDGEARDWSVVWVPLPGEGEPTSLLVVEDVSEVVRSQRLQAWAEMARMIAHEIKNPLTPIRLSTEHMVDVRTSNPGAFDDVFERCSRNILQQVDELHQIATEFSTYSKIPQVDRSEGDLVAAVREVVDSYLAAPPKGIVVRLDSPVEALKVRFDRRLFGRALRNLLENALRASARGGTVDVSIEAADNQVAVTVADRGPGVASETLDRMFDPYFSESGGTGLGLPISRRIIEQHGGTLTASNRPDGGLAATIRLPLDADVRATAPS